MIDVVFVVLPDTLLLDLAGPAEAFRLANQALRRQGRDEAFRLRYVGPRTEAPSSVGVALAGLEPLPDALPPACWLVLLGIPDEARAALSRSRAWLDARDWLARQAASAQPPARIVTVCVGALLAADAGLIGPREVTSHHEVLDELARRAPAARVVANRLFVEDGPLLSSAGITAGIDLALHLVARTCGDALAATVAQGMVVFARRGPADPQRSPLLAFRDHLHPAVHRVQEAVCREPQRTWNAQALSDVAHVTPRHLNRLFQAHAGLSPRDYVEHVRTALARHALARGSPAERAAELAGFSSSRQWRRARARS